jgi:hypothetical protein
MRKIDLIFSFVPLAKAEFLKSPNGDFSWIPSYLDGADYPRFSEKWHFSKVSFAVEVIDGVLHLEIHQMYPNGTVVKFVLDDDISVKGLSKIIDDLNERCLSACCRYLAFARVTKSDPVGFIDGMVTFDAARTLQREVDYLEAYQILFSTNSKFTC